MVTASMKYNQAMPTTGINTPTSSGPAMTPMLKTVMFSAFAADTISTGTILGRMALRVGWFTAKNPCWAASRIITVQTDSVPDNPVNHKPMLLIAIPTDVIMSRIRRS